MNICIIGTGYVGLVTGTCFAEMGNQVICVDSDIDKIELLKQGIIPIYEPGLQEMVENNLKAGRLQFTNSLKAGIASAAFCFIAVGTPPSEDGSADINHVLKATESIAEHMDKYMIIVNKSTVPVGTAALVKKAIREKLQLRNRTDLEFDVVSNPEFLKEGAAVNDFMRPDRVIIGTDNDKSAEIMSRLYDPFLKNNHPVLIMDIASAELTKYAANAMLATRISFMNELSRLCDRMGADITRVRAGIGQDKRIGMPFLYAGAGYGGSCLPKDVRALVQTGRSYGIEMEMASAAMSVNEKQMDYLPQLILARFGENLSDKTFAVWGLSFKPLTDDVREAPALHIIQELVRRGAHIQAYDPVAMEQARLSLNAVNNIEYAPDMMEAVKGADALLLVTEWHQFRQPDFTAVRKLLRSPVIFDGRNQYDPLQMQDLGFEYFSIGRNCHG